MPKDIAYDVADRIVLLSEATGRHCRWIVDRPRRGVYVVCGRHVHSGSSFCGEHHALVWRPVAVKRKDRASTAQHQD
jgi:hypothetical protein